ncbi:MAG: group 1 truncated hemoglobin [Hyphomonadaceae bacterium]
MSEPVTPHRRKTETSATRRTVVEGASATVLATSLPDVAGCATAASDQQGDASLYQRLGGAFAIAAVVDHFSDALIGNPMVGRSSQNAQLREWHTRTAERLPGLKFMRTLWVCNVSGGPFEYTPVRPGRTNVGLEEAHRSLRISPAEFDEVAGELGPTLDHFNIPARERSEVLAAFAAHKDEVTEGYRAANR